MILAPKNTDVQFTNSLYDSLDQNEIMNKHVTFPSTN